MNKKILLIFFFAFIIRIIALNQSLWLDEAVTANVVRNYGFMQIIGKFSPTDFHPPLYYLFMKLWTNFFGYSEIALRMPSVLFSLAAGYIVFLIAGIWGAVFFLFNPLIVYYSQEARMYMMATFLLSVSIYYLTKMLKIQNSKSKNQNLNMILLGIFLSLAFLTFYGSVFLIITIFIYLLFKKQYKQFLVSCLLFLVSFTLVGPLLYQQFINSKITLMNVANWSLVLGKADIKNLLLIPIKFSIGRISFYPKIFYWITAGVWGVWIFWKVLAGGSKNKQLLFLFVFPLFLGFLVSFFAPMLQYFRFIYLIPIMAILLSSNKNTLMYRHIMIIGFVIFSLIYLLLPQFHREDWKGLVNNLPKDKPVYMITASSDSIAYYSKNLRINELKNLSSSPSLSREIVVIPYTVDIYGLDYKKNLNKNGYQLKKEVSFRELTYELWTR